MSFVSRGPSEALPGAAVDVPVPAEAILLREGVFSPPVRLVSPPSWIEHIPFAFWIVDALKPHTFVELGTQSGNSYSAFAQAVQRGGLGTACYAIDTWTGDAQAGRFDETVFEEWSAFHERHFSTFSRLVRATFDEACPMFGANSIDLLHIDGLHTYDAVRHDFETWLPKVSGRGVVLLHDINVRQDDFGTWRLWDEIRDTHPTFAFLHGHGLGVVGIGKDLPADVRWLVSELAKHPSDAILVQRFFARLGAALEREWQVGNLRAQRHMARDEGGLLTTELDIYREQGHADEARVRANDNELAALVARPAALVSRPEPSRSRDADSKDDEEPESEDVAEEVADLRVLHDRLRESLADFAERCATSDAEVTKLRVAETMAAREQRTATRALAAVTRELEALQASRTWRLTSPLRRLGGVGFGPLLQIKSPRAALSVARLFTSPRRLLEVRRVTLSGLFDERYYRARYADVRRSGMPAVVHYVVAGAREGRSPHALFDGEFYLSHHEDVRAANANPLLHYARAGQAEVDRDPHPLFSTAYYWKHHPDLTALKTNPLAHYLTSDLVEGASPHPLFDPAFYLEQNPDVVREGLLPLAHFVERGGRNGRAPHPLFDAAFYLQQHADVRRAGTNPLVHYLEHVPGEDRDPHPLFDSSFYLDGAPDLVRLGVNPLVHFVEHGWREGRWPNPAFDPHWYLEMNPDVAASGRNPLEHFARLGWREGRDPCRELSTSDYVAAHPDIAASGTNPLYHYLSHGICEGRATKASQTQARRLAPQKPLTLQVEGSVRGQSPVAMPTIVCTTHVIPFPPRAGNEYRLLRLLEWLVVQGYRVVLLIAPLPTESISPAQVEALVERIGNVAVCDRDGRIHYTFASCPDILAELDGRRTQNYAARLGERPHGPPRELDLTRNERSYCHDALIETTLHLVDRLPRAALLVEYVWMTRLLPLVDARVPKILDTHDMYSAKTDKVLSFGVSDMALSPAEEAERLGRADLVLAIQDDERALMQALVPSTDVITTGIDVDIAASQRPPDRATVLLVGSANTMNCIGARDFIRFAWPSILARVPDATLLVAGRVVRCVPEDVPNVENIGPVDDLGPCYARARVVVNPTVAGTGLKIKTVEALTHNRPLVTWPNGSDGLPHTIRQRMAFPGDWLEFADHVVAHLQADSCGLDPETRSAVAAFVAPSAAYGALGDRLARFFERLAHHPPAQHS